MPTRKGSTTRPERATATEARHPRKHPVHYFRPPYVGHKGGVGVRIDNRPDWHAVAALVAEAYREVASTRQLTALEAARSKPKRGWRASWIDDDAEDS